MTLLAIGVTHHSAPLDVLDELSVDTDGAAGLAVDAVRSNTVTEAMVLTTCNRLELIADVTAFHRSTQDLADLLAKAVRTDPHHLLPHLSISYGEQAARHVFEVAAGLDSLVVGEQQIVGQVRAALAAAQDGGTAARRLNEVIQSALRSAKRIHATTDIDRHGTSVVSVGLQAAEEALAVPWDRARVVVIGAGAMASLAVSTLMSSGAADLTVLNRSPERAESMARSRGATAGGLEQLSQALATADLVVTCTGSTDTILSTAVLQSARQHTESPLTVLDLAMPHDSEPGIADLPGVSRITLADLADRPETRAREEDLAAARGILEEELAAYRSEEARRRLDPLVVSLRARAGEFVAAEADRIRARLPHLTTEEFAEVENALRRAVNALLHTPTVRVQQSAAEPDGRRLADALHALFDLPTSTIDALGAPESSENEGWW